MRNFIGNNINAIRVEYGLNQDQFAAKTGLSQTAISAWECGESTPRRSNVLKIIKAFPELTFDDVMSERNGYATKALNKNQGWVEVPLYGAIAAGTPIEMDKVDNTFVIPAEIRTRYPAAFLLKVEGESMNKKLPNGSYALINPTSEVISGNTYAVCVNGYDATIKRINKLENGFELVPDSTDPTFKSKVYDYGIEGTETITIIGEVVWCVYPFDFEF